ncbi:hypothetical protein NG895_23320 [Aeoliella sp. ICT_H6.2]|uniref:Uncharacterized protein n=1 Tax=Aeoliella straminimaris TaxID=2954799 RepID=A0A9X2JI93_9BACT|nr:hypothetical protein [Aeoliella straminimaris]MCO6046840.1 hypothetical protein [Aeoliella straminimaris]
MAEPQSPFDEPDDVAVELSTSGDNESSDELPPRKYSFMILGVMLFVLVWVREFTGMAPQVVMGCAVGVFLVWIYIHLHWFVLLPNQPSVARNGTELEDIPGLGSASYVSTVDPNSIASEQSEQHRMLARVARRGQAMLFLGMLVGIWSAYFVPLGLVGLTVLVVGLFLISVVIGRAIEG